MYVCMYVYMYIYIYDMYVFLLWVAGGVDVFDRMYAKEVWHTTHVNVPWFAYSL